MKKILAAVATLALMLGAAMAYQGGNPPPGPEAGQKKRMRAHRMHDGGPGRGRMHEHMLMMAETRLKLTPEQSQKLRSLMDQQRQRMREQREATQADRRALIEELVKQNPNQAEIAKRRKALEERHNAMVDQLIASAQEFSKGLTAEQRAELQQMISEHFAMQDKMKQRREERMKQRQQQPPPPQP